MRVLLIAVAVCVIVCAQGSAIRNANNDKETRELLKMLENILKKSIGSGSGSGTGSGDGDDSDPFDAVYNYLQENEADILYTPMYKLPKERLEQLLGKVADILHAHTDELQSNVAGLRFIVGFFEHAIYEGTAKIWEIADAISARVEEFKDMDEGTRLKRERVTRSLNARKEFAKENVRKALNAKNTKLTKKMFEDQASKMTLRNKVSQRSSEEDIDVDDVFDTTDISGFSGYEYCHYSAVYDHIAGPAYDAVWQIREIIAEHDYYFWGNIYYELEYLAEDEGILQASVEDAVFAFAYHYGNVLFSPPASAPADNVWERLVPTMAGVVEGMEQFDGTNIPEVDELSNEQQAIFAQIYLAVGPLIKEAAKPLRRLVDGFIGGDIAAIEAAITHKLGSTFGRQLYILSNLAEILREQLPRKADALAIIEQGLKDGKQEDILVAIFTKFAEAGLAHGERLENMLYFFGHILDHVAYIVEPNSGKPEDYGLGFSGTSGGSSGGYKRFLKMPKN